MRTKTGERFDPDLMTLMILGMMHVIGDNCFLGMLSKPPTEYIPGVLKVILGEELSE